MKKSLYVAASTLALGAFAAPVFAGGLTQPVMEPAPIIAAPAPVAVSTGRDWTGIYAGAQLGYAWGTRDFTDADDVDLEGALGGLHIGFDRDFGQFVVGAEASYNTADIKEDEDLGALDEMLRVGLRAGYDAGNALVYATGGWARAQVTDIDDNETEDDGYYAGVGVDYFMADNWTVGGQLLVHRFDDFDGTDVDVTATSLEARVSYRF